MRSISREHQRTSPHLKDLSSELRTSGAPANQRINLTIEALRERADNAPEIITFSPWLVGDRDDLLRSLFDELATAAVRIDPIDTPEIAERNGDPDRNTQKMPLRTRRSFTRGTPRGLFGSIGLMEAHSW